ncbi:MAG: molybdenum cofactor guanylyltransferase [Mariniblastus sp.]
MPAEKHISNLKPDPIEGLGAVVLCGGQSTRVGVDKTELVFQGQTFLERVVEQVASVADKVVLVGQIASDAHRIPNDVEVLQDERAGDGPLEGIRVGLKYLSDRQLSWAFVTSCDVPLIKPELIRFLFANRGETAIVPNDGIRIYGMTAIYKTDLHQQLLQRIVNKQLRVSELADALAAKTISVEELKGIDPELDSFTNINSAKDYLELLKRFDLDCPPELARRLAEKK